jgi:hypothetical protein
MVEPMVLDAITQVVKQSKIKTLIEEEFDRVLSSMLESQAERRDVVEAERAGLKAERDRLVNAVARGTLTDEEVRVRMEHIRDRLEHLSTERQQLRFEGRRFSDFEAERARLMALAADFGTQAKRLSGQRLRDLVQPWLESAVFDKHKRRLTLTIRRVPGLRLCASLSSPGRD